MVKVAYDVFAPPIQQVVTQINAKYIFDTSVSPWSLKGWFEPNYKIGVKFPMDGNIYLDQAQTKALFANRIPTRPSSGGKIIALVNPLKDSIIMVYYGQTSADYDTPVIIAINKVIGALLIYNISSNTITINHHTDVYPYYETNGTYNPGTTPPTVTLAQGQYVLFYTSTKPTVNTNAPWGFTDYEPLSSTTQPTNYLDVTDGTTHYYYSNPLGINEILRYDTGKMFIVFSNAVFFALNAFNITYYIRGGRNADFIESRLAGGGLATSYTLTGLTVHNINHIYDYDPPSGISWSGGQVLSSMRFVKDQDGIVFIIRYLKTTTDPFNPRYTHTYVVKLKSVDSQTLMLKELALFKTLTNITSYGSTNQVINPGVALGDWADPATFEYFNGSSWVTATPGTNSYNYYTGYGIRASVYNPLDKTVKYKVAKLFRKYYYSYGSPPLKIGSLAFSAYTGHGLLGVFLDYNGATIPSGNYIGFLAEALIRLDNTNPTITTESPTQDTDLWTYLYGSPYTISVSAPSSGSPGSTITVTVTTNAPDGKKVYVVDKDTDQVLGSGTVSGGTASVSFTMPNKTLKIRVYVEGDDLDLVSA